MLSMARFLVYCLILVNANLISAISADSHEERQVIAEAPMARRLGNRDLHSNIPASSPSPSPSPGPTEGVEESAGAAAEEQVMRSNHHRHHRYMESVAGGGAVIGVLVAGFLVAIFCYIRATGRKHVQPGSPTLIHPLEERMYNLIP